MVRTNSVRPGTMKHKAMSTYPKRASLAGRVIEIFRLVSSGATPEQWAEWLRVPLEHAAAQGNHGLVDKLLGAGADGSAGWKGCGGRSLLYAGAVGGSEGVVSSLLRAGAKPDVNVLSPAPSGRSPLYQATSGGHEAAARLLIHAGADVRFTDPKYEYTVLHRAILGGHGRLAKELMMSGAEVETRDCFDRTPLHVAAGEGLEGAVSALLLRGVDKNAVDEDGYSALMFASGAYGKPHPAIVETLLAAGADFNIRASGGSYSSLDWACQVGSVPSIQALVRYGADANSRDDIQGLGALHRAALNDQARAVDALIEAGADIELRRNGGITPLCVAAEVGKSNALLALLQKGAILSVQDNAGCTPLHVACLFQREEGVGAVVDMLLRWGADETALDEDGDSQKDLLDTVHEGRTCSQDDIERVRLLLARAPADRAWRRRGWLAMLRSRVSRANARVCGEGIEGSEDGAGGGASEGRKVARSEDVVDIVRSECGGQTNSGGDAVGLGITGAVGNGVFGHHAVVRLVGVKPEGVFRTVLEFL